MEHPTGGADEDAQQRRNDVRDGDSNVMDTATTTPSIRIPTPTVSDEDNSFLPLQDAQISSSQQDDEGFSEGVVSPATAGVSLFIQDDDEEVPPPPVAHHRRQVSFSEGENYHEHNDEDYQDDESQYDDDDFFSYDSQESYESSSEFTQDEDEEQQAQQHQPRSSVIAIGIPAPPTTTTNEQDEHEDEQVTEQQEVSNQPTRFKTIEEVHQEAVSQALAQGVAEAEHDRKHKTKGDSSKHKMVPREKSASLKSNEDHGDWSKRSLKSSQEDSKKRRASLRSLDDAVSKKIQGEDVPDKTTFNTTSGASIVYGTRRTTGDGGLLIDGDDDDDEEEDLEAQAGIPVVMPGAFAMEGMDAAPGRQITGYDSGFDNSDSESDVEQQQRQPSLRRHSTRQMSVMDEEPEAPPMVEIEGELHQEPQLVDALALHEDELPMGEIKVPMKVRLAQASILCCTLVAIGVIVGLVVALSGSTDSSNTDENTLIGWEAVGEPLVAPQSDRDGSYFGSAVSLSSDGSRLAVASPGWDDMRSPNRQNIGQVLVYDWKGESWELVGQELNGPGPRTTTTGSLSLSQTVALSKDGRRVAFGSPDWNKGQVAILQEPSSEGGSWTLVGQNITGEENDDGRFGYSVAMSSTGKTVAVGDPFAMNQKDGSRAGIVRVYREAENSIWTQVGQALTRDAAFELNGWSVALSSDGLILAIGSPGSGVSGDFTGSVRVFRLNETGWTRQLGRTIRGDSVQDKFGHCVSLSDDGNLLAVGGWQKPDANTGGIFVGHVRIYKYDKDAEKWEQMGSDLTGSDLYDNFGYSVALSADGMKVVVGSPRTNSIIGGFAPRGHINVFGFDGSEWRKQGGTISSTQDFENLGHSVAISGDSTLVAGGAPGASFDSKYNNVGRVGLWTRSTR